MNRLQYEISPYLLQHAHNPVDWYAWKPEAFERARKENKPILVSIGYSTCHWCHVMERESFENEDIAGFMNERFINIKVDREERPDVDAIYMEACQIFTGGGGWPLNCFLTPEGKPFYAGTYFPPRPAHNRPSWLQLLQYLADIWETKRETALEQADKMTGHIRQNEEVLLGPPPTAGAETSGLQPAVLDKIFFEMRQRFDGAHGGFGGAPKFPSTMAIQYLLAYHYYTGSSEALEHALFSLEKMIQGGIYDQLGGGFARYATDREWLVPHFEKMLYDNALLVSVMSEAYKLLGSGGGADAQRTRRQGLLKESIEETLAYTAREMTHVSGGFYSAQDADSEGVEGKFYVWTRAEIEQELGELSGLFCDFYDVSAEGNWEEHNILNRPASFENFAAAHGLELDQLKSVLSQGREKLLALRSKRIYPGLDDKILLSWNALMSSAYAAAFTALGTEAYRETAVRNIDFVLQAFENPENPGALMHSWKGGKAQYDAFLEDYAYLIAALVDTYQISFDEKYIDKAAALADYVVANFYDSASGLFYFTNIKQSDVLFRKKEIYDNATPSGNSTMLHNFQRLGVLLDRRDWQELSGTMLQRMQNTIERFPLSFERWALGLMNAVHPMKEIAVVGGNARGKAGAIQRYYLPNRIIAASENMAGADSKIALLAGRPGENDALIYVCQNYTCLRPVQTIPDFLALLNA